MLHCDLRQDYVQTLVRDYAGANPEEIRSTLSRLVSEGLDALGEHNRANAAAIDCRLDLRYRGQEYTISVPLPGADYTAADRGPAAARFHELHRSLYGHAAPDEALELVSVRVTVHRDIEQGRRFAPSSA